MKGNNSKHIKILNMDGHLPIQTFSVRTKPLMNPYNVMPDFPSVTHRFALKNQAKVKIVKLITGP